MLKVEIDKKVLEEGLKKVVKALPSKKEAQEIGFEDLENSIKLIGNAGDSMLTLNVLLPDDSLKVKLQCNVLRSGEVIIKNVKNIVKAFKYFKNETLVKLEENEEDVTISNIEKDIKVSKITTDEFMKDLKIGEIKNSYIYNTKDLYNRIKKVDHAISKDDVRPILTGICFDGDNIVSLDGYILALSKDEALNFDNKIVINPKTIKLLIDLLNKKEEKELSINANDEYIVFEFEDVEIAGRLLEGNFLNYKDILRTDHSTTLKIDTKQLEDNIKFLNEFAKESRNKVIKMTVNDNDINLDVSNKDGSYNSNLDADISTNGYFTSNQIAFNGKYFADIMKVIDSNTVKIGLMSSLSPILFHDNKETYLLLPIRLS